MKPDIKYRCYNFSLEIIRFTSELKINWQYRSVIDQLFRSATSGGANVVEGKSGSSKKDLIRFYQIALKSANETKYWLCLLRDGLGADKERTDQLLKEADEISKIISASIISLKKNIVSAQRVKQ